MKLILLPFLTLVFPLLSQSTCEDLPEDYTGDCVTYYDNGRIHLKGTFLNGLPHGELFEFYEDGTTKSSYLFSDSTGTMREFHHNGKRSIDGIFRVDREKKLIEPTGIWIQFDENGLPSDSTDMDLLLSEDSEQLLIEELEKALENLEEEESGYIVEEKAETLFTDDVIQFPEHIAEFPGGDEAMLEYIHQHLVYPPDEGDITGRVYMRFIVDEEGAISQIEVLRGLGKSADREAVKLVENMPRWVPGKDKGKVCKSLRFLVVNFNM